MRLVLAAEELASFGGSQSYLTTIAEELERLGHGVTVYTALAGEAARLAGSRGLRVVDSVQALPERCDGFLAQDTGMAYELASRYPDVARLYVAHSREFVQQLPPQAPEVASTVVVMNDRLATFCESLAQRYAVVRLRQPVDLSRFGRLGLPNPRPRAVIVFGNAQGGLLYERIRGCCLEQGLAVHLLGRHGTATAAPELELERADIVVGIGRCAVEGMAARRAVYVSGIVGSDGWITPASYEAIEADGFSGRATETAFDPVRFQSDLRRWSPELGEASRDLVYRHHDVTDHAAELVRLWGAAGSHDAPGPLDELARLARAQGRLENRAVALESEVAAARQEAEHLRAYLAFLKATRRYRIGAALARPLDRVRTLLSRVRAKLTSSS